MQICLVTPFLCVLLVCAYTVYTHTEQLLDVGYCVLFSSDCGSFYAEDIFQFEVPGIVSILTYTAIEGLLLLLLVIIIEVRMYILNICITTHSTIVSGSI